MTTMRDVAAVAGVSAKTVSRVFNDDPHVLPETRERVRAAIRELDYLPNTTATTFRAGKQAVIGVAVPDVVDPFFANIVRAVDSAARERGFSTLVTSLGADPHDERATLESLLSRKPTGLIVAPVGLDHAWLARWQRHTPLVFVDRAPRRLRADSFTFDDDAGAHLGTTHLVARGHRRVAFIGNVLALSTETHRLAGHRRALEDAGIGWDPDLVLGGVADRDRAREALGRLRALDQPPTAVFSGNALTSIALAAVLGRRRLATVGFGDFPLADVIRPAWTVIDQSPAVLGALAAARVFDRVADPARRLRRTTVLDVRLVERDSSAR